MSDEVMTLAPASKKQEQFLNSDATITLAGGSAGCFDKDTEYLTPEGWKKFSEYKEGDLVAEYNPTRETVLFTEPLEYIKKPCELFYRFVSDDFDFCLSDEHRVAYFDTPNGTIQTILAEELFARLKEKSFTGFVLVFTKEGRKYVPIETCNAFLQYTKNANKYCFSVRSTFLLVRRSGMVYVSGNSGKALRHGEKVLTDQGFRNIEDVAVGDTVITPNNTKETIVGVYPQGLVHIYRVTFWDGSTVDTCGEHLWSVRYDVESDFAVQNTLQIREKLQDGYRPRIPIADALDLPGSTIQQTLNRCKNYFKNASNPDDNDRLYHAFPLGLTNWAILAPAEELPALQQDLRSLGFLARLNASGTGLTIRGKDFSLLLDPEYNLDVYPDVDNFIMKIEAIGQDYATCIAISGPDKLFITSNFVVTHNTFVSLLIALKFMQHPRATGVIFRRTSKMITSPGSIWHEAVSLYTSVYKTGLRIRHRENEIVFPNGALLKFSHMQHASNMYDHKG